MANEVITPNMSLPSPVPGVAPGPVWAQDNYNCLALIDSHDHTPGKGVQIPVGGLNINADFPFNGNNGVTIRSLRFLSQGAPLALATDIGCLYESGVDLYYNDGSGNQIRITQSGSVAGSSGTITGLPSGTASAAFVSASGTFVFQQATSTAANIDGATYVLRYPGSYPTPAGNYIALQAPTSLASGYALTYPATLPAANNSFSTVSTAGAMSYTRVDGSSITVGGGFISINTGGVTQVKVAIRTTGTTVAAGGIATSSSSGTFSTTSPTAVDATNLSVTITTLGNPVWVALIPDGSTSESVIGVSQTQPGTNATYTATFEIVRSATIIATSAVDITIVGIPNAPTLHYSPPGSLAVIDAPSAGTYTYKVTARSNLSSTTAYVTRCKLVVYEIK